MKTIAFLLACLVVLLTAARPAGAYYPPVPVQGSVDGTKVNYAVLDPKSGAWKYGSDTYASPVTNFQQNNGLLAWISQEGAAYYVHFLTYDPYRQQWEKNDIYSAGPYAHVYDFTLNNGVAAWRYLRPDNTPGVGYATYSPRYGIWYWSGMDWAASSLLNKDGVVAYFNPVHGVIANIYDAYYEGDTSNGPWRYTNVWDLKATSLAIQNATVSYLSGANTYTVGYDPGDGHWHTGWQTKLRAYFLAQPAIGPLPLWVWFTDMSIGGTSWSWQLGDGATSHNRSLYHNYTKGVVHSVTQTITGAAPDGSHYTKTVGAAGMPGLSLLLAN